ncbi:MAG: hypothetical protein A4S09_17095 [Proteobacteria bacterium SG_bin7]|nr:MAG: hypothetical protein A4S09_17095 [Proteobacteria bacterium SG_bin7]
MKQNKRNFNGVKNTGRTLAKRLNEIGVYNLSDLKKMGSVTAYKKIVKSAKGRTVPLCYNLYSFEGAIRNCDWRELSESTKSSLLQKIERRK